MTQPTIIECIGLKKTYVEWEKHPQCTVKHFAIKARINRGMTPEKAIFTPDSRGKPGIAAVYPFADEMLTVKEISERINMNPASVRLKCKRGEDLSQLKIRDDGSYIGTKTIKVLNEHGEKVTKQIDYIVKVTTPNPYSVIDDIDIPAADEDLHLKNLIASLTAMGFKGNRLIAEARKRMPA